MNFIELTRPDGNTVLINKSSINSVMTYGTNTVLLFSGGYRQEVKETYDQIKSILKNPMIIG